MILITLKDGREKVMSRDRWLKGKNLFNQGDPETVAWFDEIVSVQGEHRKDEANVSQGQTGSNAGTFEARYKAIMEENISELEKGRKIAALMKKG